MATSIGLSAFALRMEVRAKEARVGIDRVFRQVVIAADQVVVTATPVDTGRARSNWLGGVGSAPTGAIAPYAPGSKLGIGESANAQGAITQATEALKGRKPGEPFVLANNLDYIGALNNGSSAQASAGFVQKGVLAAASSIRNAKVFLVP